MAAYTAVIGDARSIGAYPGSIVNPTGAASGRLNPQVATARVRNILNPHIVSDAVGGLISADFMIPAEEAIRWRPLIRYGAVVWLFDGATPLFQGYAEQPVWTANGDCQMTVSGPWVMLQRSRMREAWDLWDLSLYTRGVGANENKAGQVNITADGAVTFSFPNGTVVATSDRVSINYVLFGEALGVADGKLLTAFEFDITASQGLSAARRFRVRGQDTPTTGAADLLYDTISNGSSTVQGALNLNGTNQGGGAWPSSVGYRCLVFQMVFTTGSTLSTQDVFVTLDRIRVSTREALFQTVSGGVVNPLDTGAIARDVVTPKRPNAAPPFGGTFGNVQTDFPSEFILSNEAFGATDSNTAVYGWGLNPQIGTGSAPNSGVGTTGFTALEWQSPADLLAQLAEIDGSHVGFYLPYNGRGGYDPPGAAAAAGFAASDVGSFWLTAPPQLYYQAFTDPTTNPDYTIQTQEGAVVTPAADAQPLINYLCTNYQTIKGRQQSVVVQDASPTNYAFVQGYRRVDDYTIQPSVGDNQTPTSQAAQYLKQRRLAVSTATITIQNDGTTRYAIMKQGCVIPRLATIRPGSLQINGSSTASTISAGYATHVEWWGQSDSGPEQVELTLAQPPGQVSAARAHGRLANRTHRTRHRIL